MVHNVQWEHTEEHCADTPCGKTAIFKTEKQRDLWSRLHSKKCGKCKNSNLNAPVTVNYSKPVTVYA